MRPTRGLRWARAVVLAVLTGFVAVPLYAVLLTSLRPLADTTQAFGWTPRHLTFSAFSNMWRTAPLARYLLNSLVVASAVTGMSLLLGLPAGYALARATPRRRSLGGLVLLTLQAAPGLLFVLPLFLLYARVAQVTGHNLIGTRTGLVLADLTLTVPLTVWLLAAVIGNVSTDLDDAARVDGAGTITTLLRVIAPAIAPGILTGAALAFLASWGEVLFATVLTDDSTATLPIGLHAYTTQSLIYWNQLSAAAITTSAPILIVFLLLQKRIGAVLTGQPDTR